jgi:outer membrane lipoprotein-sorting protein
LYDVKAGQVIKVPSYYAKETVMYINTKTYLLYKILVYDLKGLYESYEFRNLKLNVNFKPNEFTKDFPEYGF